jgi:hypothetical protein
VRLFPTDHDGQKATDVSPIFYGAGYTGDIAQLGGAVYMGQALPGNVVQLNDDGTIRQTVVSGLGTQAEGLAVNPVTGHLYYAVQLSNLIADIDPVAHTSTVFAAGYFDGLTVSADGSTLYGTRYNDSHIIGYDIATRAVVFDSDVLPGTPDGLGWGSGPLAGNLYVNCNNGTVVELNPVTGARTVVASGGSRGDFVTKDPNDGSLLLTQLDLIERLSFPPGPATTLAVAAPAKVQAGTPFTITVTALDADGHIATNYRGTVTFATTDPDPNEVLPADYTFTAADGGVHTFTNTGLGETTLWTRGFQTVTATDTADNSILGNVTVKVRQASNASLLPVFGGGLQSQWTDYLYVPEQPGQDANGPAAPEAPWLCQWLDALWALVPRVVDVRADGVRLH